MHEQIELQVGNLRGTFVFFLPTFDPLQRKVYGATLSKRRRLWFYPAFPPFHEKVLSDLKTLFPERVTLSATAVEYLAELDEELAAAANQDLGDCQPKFSNYDHQNEALALALRYPRYGLFLGRGLGKTKIAVDLMCHLRKRDPKFRCLILALRVNLWTWHDEMEKFTGGEYRASPLVAANPKQRSKRLDELVEANPLAIVCTYDTARVAWEELMQKFDYSMIVADESHKLRGHKSQQTQAAIRLAQKASRRLLLTGTPSLGNPMHLWGQLRFLAQFIVPGWWDYSNTYLKRSPYNQHIIVGYKNQDRLNKMVSAVSIYKEAEECLDLPERTFEDILVDPTAKQRTLYNTLVASGEVTMGGEKASFPEPVVRIGKLAQLATGFMYVSKKDPTICDGCPNMIRCVNNGIHPYTSSCVVDQQDPGASTHWVAKNGGPVIAAVKELALEHLNGGKKIIVWAAHRAALSKLHEVLDTVTPEDKSKVKVLRFDSTAEAPHLVEKEFNESAEARILVAQISMGIGVTFNAPVMIYAQMSPSLDHWLQSQDRNWGIRAKGHSHLIVQTVAVRGSLQASMAELVKKKIDVSMTMTKKPTCVGCEKLLECLAKGIDPFTAGCKYSKSTVKTKLGMSLLR